MDAALERFSPATREWFAGAFDAPTPAQTGAWEAISSGRHALVVAPTGSVVRTPSSVMSSTGTMTRRSKVFWAGG